MSAALRLSTENAFRKIVSICVSITLLCSLRYFLNWICFLILCALDLSVQPLSQLLFCICVRTLVER